MTKHKSKLCNLWACVDKRCFFGCAKGTYLSAKCEHGSDFNERVASEQDYRGSQMLSLILADNVCSANHSTERCSAFRF